MQKAITRFSFPFLVLLVLFGCSGYEKVLKSGDFRAKYRAALEYYETGDYVRAGTIFDQISSVYRGTEQADTVYFYQAMSYYHQADYILAGHYFRNFARVYGASPFVEQSDFLGAYCYYMTSPKPSLDQTNTVLAIQAFQLHLIRYPEGDKKEEVIGYINELRNKLVEKSFISARLYFDLEDYKASTVALENALSDFPDSKYREEIMFMIVKSSYMLASKSILTKKKTRYQDTIDEYYSFAAEYPESKFIKEANKYYRQSSSYLGDDIEMPEENEVN